MDKAISVRNVVKKARLIFWDFDGVIKESIDIKTKAFIALFQQYGMELAEKIKNHHEANGGMSRLVKFPIYLEWANEKVTPERLHVLNKTFNLLSLDGVVNAPWVPGAEEYLRNNPDRKLFVVISATPKEELVNILEQLDLSDVFIAIYGSPTSKKDAIAEVLQKHNLAPANAIMIGDSIADFEAAAANHVPFVLRRNASNASLFLSYTGHSIDKISEL